ncbi:MULTISPECIES: cbb3-type cytochrome c oxidase subunit I [unclassified Wenzhouxiangella]|uniref:cbb3-type cytochrome c oxidase subunit I n=1 Tax=unclassified Wenzhouxiangella TaxID=2613841 RepID=UPI000E32A514|nr:MULTISPECIES: cbb3-type cytochrome c oxidase subunit I [unclassified Wenzhouxiangella]RFF27375.1 cytochrome C oxidase subunit I [Wenzhouxiangella sp. 15181]RFP68803.1 cytochrome C oxidase subunit I [Wenzhouxiangella sp. 15190]
MNSSNWNLAVPSDFRGRLARAWLLTAVGALLISGLFVILIVASRTPGVEQLFPLKNFFHLAIVVHVDFSVLVWFAAFGAVMWTLVSTPAARRSAWLGLGLVIAGSVLLAASPFRPGEAIMSNYVPVLDNTLFLSGLSVLGIGVLVSSLRTLFNPLPGSIQPAEAGVMRFGVQTGVIALVLAGGLLLWSLFALPPWLDGAQYYEVLFWGGGHVLQFAWVQFMLVAWLWLAAAAGLRFLVGPRLVLGLLLAGVLPAFLAVWGYLYFEVGGPGHRTFFIWLMAAGGGLAAGPLGLALVLGWMRSQSTADSRQRGLRTALLFSIGLFGLGGALGFLIDESNTIVPAHYHGCIVAITLTFMALSLHLLPRFGFAPAGERLTRLMPWVYGGGQVLHVFGLALAGGHGVQRKTAGAAQGLEGLAQVGGMAVMGAGGLIAIIGGILFLIAFARALISRAPGIDVHIDKAPHHA